ncbi:MAG: UDP-N-acetylglucosamine--N-acetylmuramyl-(pentapeptide) pyrophosphoryl-undecaprenol N-acetylglucosamine transferase [Fimbriimonas sp.]|nr:UDP-N-acetylglucosamine--N-acetylmuramyl-(pentapeptide) pyrophosphoryl-undecaprenol N-acetylglucosamine transferase [Fimbriimonas sp.]
MRLVITGGGTGGHIYPAIEVGKFANERGADLLYFGSLRGQESRICEREGIPFTGFASEPLMSMKTLKGLRSLVRLQKARSSARRALKSLAPDVVFSTGGYSAGPVVAAARDVKIPYTIHTADSVPARSSSMFAKESFAFTCTFRSTVEFMTEVSVIRTGQPIRRELRQAAKGMEEIEPLVLVLGGSQGSQFLNQTVPQAAALGEFEEPVLHVAGPKNLDSTLETVRKLGLESRYRVVAFLEGVDMGAAYRRASLVVARSGGTLAELALFGLPSVLVPLPTSANNHQLHNAVEFVNMHAATLLAQAECTAEKLSAATSGWLRHSDRRETARRNLMRWDVPDATDRIVTLIEEAAK